MLGTGAGHDRVHGHLLHRVFQFLLVDGHRHPADDLLGVGGGAGEHVGDTLLRGQDDGGAVGPAVLQEEPCRLSSLSGLSSRGRGAPGLASGCASSGLRGRVSASTICGMMGRPVTGSFPSTYLRRTSRGLPTRG